MALSSGEAQGWVRGTGLDVALGEGRSVMSSLFVDNTHQWRNLGPDGSAVPMYIGMGIFPKLALGEGPGGRRARSRAVHFSSISLSVRHVSA